MSGNPVSGQFNLSGSQVDDPDTKVGGGYGPGVGVGPDVSERRGQPGEGISDQPVSSIQRDGNEFNQNPSQNNDPSRGGFGPGMGAGQGPGVQENIQQYGQGDPSKGGDVSGSFNLSGSQIDDSRDDVYGESGPGSGRGLDLGAGRPAQGQQQSEGVPSEGGTVSGSFSLSGNQIDDARERLG